MKTTKEQMFDMKHMLMILFKRTVIYSSFDSKGHGNVTVVDRDDHFFFVVVDLFMKENTHTYTHAHREKTLTQ